MFLAEIHVAKFLIGINVACIYLFKCVYELVLFERYEAKNVNVFNSDVRRFPSNSVPAVRQN